MVMFTFSVSQWKYAFWANLFPKFKIVSLSWSLVSIIVHKVCETSSSFLCEIAKYGKVLIYIFQQILFLFFFIIIIFFLWGGGGAGWAVGYNSVKFSDFSDLSQFPKILNFKSLGNWYMPCS